MNNGELDYEMMFEAQRKVEDLKYITRNLTL